MKIQKKKLGGGVGSGGGSGWRGQGGWERRIEAFVKRGGGGGGGGGGGLGDREVKLV